VPQDTAKLRFAMTDLNVPSFHHGGDTVAYRGQPAVPCGAFASGFTGPSPPPGQVHTYQFSIKALGPNGAVLATTTTRRKVSGVTIALIGRPQTHPVRRTELNARRQSIFTCAGLNAARTG